MTAAPGAAQLAGGRIQHVAARHKRSGEPVAFEDVDSGDEDARHPGQSHLLDKRKALDGHWVDVFFPEEADSDVATWTLVAKELLTVRYLLLLLSLLWHLLLLSVSLCNCIVHTDSCSCTRVRKMLAVCASTLKKQHRSDELCAKIVFENWGMLSGCVLNSVVPCRRICARSVAWRL